MKSNLLNSIVNVICNTCNIEHNENEKCPKCLIDGGTVVFKSGNCTKCIHFITDSMSYPSGKCKKHDIITGIKKYCSDFELK